MSHPLHPAVVHFPIATWSLGTIADIAGLWFGDAAWRYAGPLHVIGTLTAFVAMAAGLVDFVRVPAGSAASKYITRHVLLVFLAFSAYAASLAMRFQESALHAPSAFAIVASIVGFVLLAAAGWQGGQLVYRHGVNVAGR